MSNKFFPVFIPMENRLILVVGGGSVALRRVRSLLDFGARIWLISEEICEELEELAHKGQILAMKKRIGDDGLEAELGLAAGRGEVGQEETDLPFCVLAASSDEELNTRIVRLCRERGIWVNNASSKEECDFYFPAIVEKEGIVMGVSSQGQSPARVREICKRLREEKTW